MSESAHPEVTLGKRSAESAGLLGELIGNVYNQPVAFGSGFDGTSFTGAEVAAGHEVYNNFNFPGEPPVKVPRKGEGFIGKNKLGRERGSLGDSAISKDKALAYTPTNPPCPILPAVGYQQQNFERGSFLFAQNTSDDENGACRMWSIAMLRIAAADSLLLFNQLIENGLKQGNISVEQAQLLTQQSSVQSSSMEVDAGYGTITIQRKTTEMEDPTFFTTPEEFLIKFRPIGPHNTEAIGSEEWRDGKGQPPHGSAAFMSSGASDGSDLIAYAHAGLNIRWPNVWGSRVKPTDWVGYYGKNQQFMDPRIFATRQTKGPFIVGPWSSPYTKSPLIETNNSKYALFMAGSKGLPTDKQTTIDRMLLEHGPRGPIDFITTPVEKPYQDLYNCDFDSDPNVDLGYYDVEYWLDASTNRVQARLVYRIGLAWRVGTVKERYQTEGFYLSSDMTNAALSDVTGAAYRFLGAEASVDVDMNK